MRTMLHIAVALALLPVTAGTATAASIVLNGGFETGTFADWTATPGGMSLFGVGSTSPRSGSYAAFFGGVNFGGGDQDTISQSLATTAGQSYVLDFWLAQDVTFPCDPFTTCLENDFSAFWNGTPILFIKSEPEFQYTRYTFLLLATAPTSIISFAGASSAGEYRLDDVSVSEIPEPASLLLLSGGLAVWFAGRLRRGRRNT